MHVKILPRLAKTLYLLMSKLASLSLLMAVLGAVRFKNYIPSGK